MAKHNTQSNAGEGPYEKLGDDGLKARVNAVILGEIRDNPRFWNMLHEGLPLKEKSLFNGFGLGTDEARAEAFQQRLNIARDVLAPYATKIPETEKNGLVDKQDVAAQRSVLIEIKEKVSKEYKGDDSGFDTFSAIVKDRAQIAVSASDPDMMYNVPVMSANKAGINVKELLMNVDARLAACSSVSVANSGKLTDAACYAPKNRSVTER